MSDDIGECVLVGMDLTQPQKTRVRLWKGHTNSQVVASIFDLSQNGHWQELHHDSEGFYVEQGQ